MRRLAGQALDRLKAPIRQFLEDAIYILKKVAQDR